MGWFSAIPIVGNIIDGVIGLIDKTVEDKDEAAKLKSQMIAVFQNADLEKFTSLVKAQAGIVMAEANGHSWLQRNWRPLLMLIFMVIIANNFIIHPYVSLFTGGEHSVALKIPENMWALLKIGVGGYVVGRSGETITKLWKAKS
jgi:hypothetical protein